MVVVNVYVVDTIKSIYVIESSIQKSAVVFAWQMWFVDHFMLPMRGIELIDFNILPVF